MAISFCIEERGLKDDNKKDLSETAWMWIRMHQDMA
jgi:hypothetical protein